VTFVGLCVDGTAVVYNKFDVSSSSSRDHHPPHPASDHDCVVDTVGHWTAARCAEEHLTVCQSDHLIAPGKYIDTHKHRRKNVVMRIEKR